MNHIYKVIWNRTRACWQVVSELAKSHGKTQSSRRRRRLAGALRQAACTTGHNLRDFPAGQTRSCRKLAAVMTVLFTCSLGGGMAGVVYAAEGETTATGVLSYGNLGADAQNIFKNWQAGKVSQPGSYYNPIVISSTAKFGYTDKDTGVTTVPRNFTASRITPFIDAINADLSTNYNSIVIVIQLPGESAPRTYTYPKGTTVDYNSVITTLNTYYWQNLDIAKQIAAATQNGDTAALQQLISAGLPRFYVAVDGDWQNGTQLSVPSGVTYAQPFTLASYSPGLHSTTIATSTTPSDSSYSFSYQNQTIAEDGVWRPMDRLETTTTASLLSGDLTVYAQWTIDSNGNLVAVTDGGTVMASNPSGTTEVITDPTVITVKDLTAGKNATIDLSYLNTHYDVNGNFNPSDSIVSCDTINHYGGAFRGYGGTYPVNLNGNQYQRSINRYLLVNNATLADGTTLRLGVYGLEKSTAENKTTAVDSASKSDSVYIANATTADGHANLYVELGWVPGVGTTSQGEATCGGILLGILNGAENFTVTGRTSLADGVFSQYEITPVISQVDNYFNISGTKDASGFLLGEQGTVWQLDSYSYLDLNTASESGRSAADNAVATNNLWKSNYLNLFRRAGTLHRRGYLGEQDQKENVWAEVWHGKYDSASGYGRRLDQTYNGVQVGYDKLLDTRIANGKVYNGLYLSKVTGDTTTATGGGDQDSGAIGVYAAWVGDKGHYLDAALLASKLSNNYHLTANTGDGTIGRVTGDYNTWAYGLGLQYGYQSPVKNGWFWEPSVALFAGRVNSASYSLSNNLGIRQDSYDTVTGRLGLSVGKELAAGKGNLYAGIAALHEFAGSSSINSFYGTQQRPLDTAGGKDTWWEFSLGGNMKISPTGAFNLDLTKTASGNNGNDWKVNGGFNWTWGGFWSGSKAAAQDQAAKQDITASLTVPTRRNATVVVGQAPAAPVQAVTQLPADSRTVTAPDSQTNPAAGQTTAAEETAPAAGADIPAGNNTASAQPAAPEPASPPTVNTGGYTFAPVTVEAARPDWEKQLSPGQVSVIYPDQFAGEQKDLPNLLERVPGLFVQRVSGDGHYTVARVRGSTGAQVNVYVDGVLMNLNGDAAVNLSTIPVDNVERVEVYRGYVPARFSGSPLGGVINIVTKKPDKVGGSISQGVKSYGGYTGNYQLTAPVGSGSLMATYQRDIWDGDFPFTIKPETLATNKDFGDANRRSNGYKNSNGMVKWQDDNWMVKTSWKQLHEELPRPVNRLVPDSFSGNYHYRDYYAGFFDAEQDIDQKEFQIGWRDTKGSLDWGWKLYYLDSKKKYQAVGLLRAGYTSSNFTDYPGYLWSDYHSRKYGANLNTALKMGASHLLEFNFDYSHETMDADGSNWDTFDDSMAMLHRKFIHQYKIKEYHLTLQDAIALNRAGDFKLIPVLRADKVEMDTMAENDQKWQYSGAVALQKQLNEHWSVKTNWGTYNRHPNFYELFGDGATIKPNKYAAKYFDLAGDGTWESGHQFDFSLNWQGKMAKADTDTVLTWFQRRSQNQFALWQPSVPNAPATYFPMDDARVHGLELTHNMKWDRVSLNLAGTWQKSDYSGYTMNGVTNGRKSNISYTPEWVWNARLDYRFPGDKLNVFTEYTYTDKQFLGSVEDGDSYYMQALSTVDLGLKYAFDKNWKLSAGVNDIFNKGYELRQTWGGYPSTLSYPLAGRMYYATMEYKF
ncbi:Pertactin autotransporter precursor [Sporomusa ovata DSM 2662]|uniref:TonB-dependent receptor plug n=1 Tax=Sporomusa ovata TaxID=2378 RepID=A0A0U1L480_9FIRM|nr:TonB-dependent receptor [Sporomusa ovata]EQB25911.1 TonB-dependent receptor plug [Sporomusa ovata DSM 2662]CQR74488.1 TonB-dependent receptor plug [Sporomusa ovata]